MTRPGRTGATCRVAGKADRAETPEPTRRGSLTVAPDQPWDEDSASVARLREQGAVFLGKTTTPEFGWKGVTDSPLTGVTVNPWNPALTPGGSSGGAAVAAAFGMGVLHLATDGGGSIRIPAAMCGLFGFKPTFVAYRGSNPAITDLLAGQIDRLGDQPADPDAADGDVAGHLGGKGAYWALLPRGVRPR